MALDRSRFIAKFSEEAREHISALNEGLLIIEKGAEDKEVLNDIFRAAHSIKGTSRMLKLTEITEVAHKLEDLLDAIRQDNLKVTKEVSSLLFKGIDKMAEMIEYVAGGEELSSDYTEICNELAEAVNGGKASNEDEPAAESKSEVPAAEKDKKAGDKPSHQKGEKKVKKTKEESLKDKEEKIKTKASARGAGSKSEMIKVPASKLDDLINLAGEMISAHTSMKETLAEMKETAHLSARLMELLTASGDDGITEGNTKDEILDAAMKLNRQLHNTMTNFKGDISFNELFTGDLQERALKMRMLPLSTIFDTFQRTVRDMSKSLGKEISLIIEGGDTELDKKIIEKLGDPLMHMIRNAIDHGIESPSERLKTGKPEEGAIKLAAMYEGGNVIIIISDDGGGIPLKKIEARALEKKWLTKKDLAKMTIQEKISLIFRPGLSTSQMITDFSGRGVGMDVVKKNIVENLKGSIDADTREGMGTTFTIRLPSTLAIMRLLLFETAKTVFSVPSDAVTEVQKVSADKIIDVVDKKAIRLREQIIPVVYLDMLLGLPPVGHEREKEHIVVIVNTGIEKLGLIVQKLLEEQDMVIKTLPSHMAGEKWVSGVTISGKGDVINVLNVAMLIQATKELNWIKPRDAEIRSEAEKKRILVVDDSINTREIEKEILEAYGYSVDLAKDGMEALEKAKLSSYDLVVTDVEMPRMDGFTLTENLRKEAEYVNKPVIIVTSRDKLEDKRRGIQVGASAYILKGSFDQSNLLDTVESLIGSSSAK